MKVVKKTNVILLLKMTEVDKVLLAQWFREPPRQGQGKGTVFYLCFFKNENYVCSVITQEQPKHAGQKYLFVLTLN